MVIALQAFMDDFECFNSYFVSAVLRAMETYNDEIRPNYSHRFATGLPADMYDLIYANLLEELDGVPGIQVLQPEAQRFWVVVGSTQLKINKYPSSGQGCAAKDLGAGHEQLSLEFPGLQEQENGYVQLHWRLDDGAQENVMELWVEGWEVAAKKPLWSQLFWAAEQHTGTLPLTPFEVDDVPEPEVGGNENPERDDQTGTGTEGV